jgi:nitrogen PTS system EIIA component
MSVITLAPGAVVNPVQATHKNQVLELLADRFAYGYGLDREAVLERLEEREALGTTAMGHHVAIPHAKLPGIRGPLVVFLKLEKPINFEAIDGLHVDLVFGLLSPDTGGAMHLQALAELSRMLRDERTRNLLAGSGDADAAFAILSDLLYRDDAA